MRAGVCRDLGGFCDRMDALKNFNYLFLERGEGTGGGREKEKHQCVVASCAPYLCRGLACNTGMCPGWESNWRSLGSQAGTHPLSHTSQAE